MSREPRRRRAFADVRVIRTKAAFQSELLVLCSDLEMSRD